jgi:putative drug exporter of the RND superfamily
VTDESTGRLGRLAHIYAAGLVRLRWLVVGLWLALLAWASVSLPVPSSASSLGGLVPRNSPAVAAQQRSLEAFSMPVTTGTVFVLHDPDGLAPLTETDVVLHALSVDQRFTRMDPPYPDDRVLGAVPVVDPADRQTALTYLYFSPGTSPPDQTQLAHRYASHFDYSGAQTYVTGLVPAEVAQSEHLQSSVTLIEITTLALIAVVVAVVFRSLVAPLVTLGAATIAFLIDLRLLGWLTDVAGIGLSDELEPVLIALLLGVLTDYAVFFLSGFQRRLAAGDEPKTASRSAIAINGPVVLVAGLTAAAGCAALYAAPLNLYRSFGPGLAVTVVVGVVSAVTLVPAVMAILGKRVFWPSQPEPLDARERRAPGRRTSRYARLLTTRAGAAVATVICLGALGAAVAPLTGLRLSFSFTHSLPSSDPVRRGAAVLTDSFPAGAVAPTEVLVEGSNLADRRGQLSRLQRSLEEQAGVAATIGPEQVPAAPVHGIVVSPDGRTARIVLVLDSDPLGAQAIDDLRAVESRGPALARRAGLSDVTLAYAGNTAIASEVSRLTLQNLAVILAAAFGAELLILGLYLRALVAPVYLLFCSALTVAAALGLTVLVFQHGVGVGGLTFYAPFAAAVLLLALGSDYNVFGIGRIWGEAARRPLRDAIRTVLPRTSRAISTAGVTLAGSFALLAIIPLRTFTELAFAMTAGLLIDTFVVRSVLTPSLLTLVGTVSDWPGHRLHRHTAHAVRPGDELPSAAPGPAAGSRSGGRASRRWPRWRLPTKIVAQLVIVAAAYALAGWGLDWLSRIGAQSLVARSIQRAEHLAIRPNVDVHGWFFVPQVVSGEYDEVDVFVQDIHDGPLRLADVRAQLYGVHVPLHDVVTRDVSAVPVDRTHETVTLTYADVNAYLRAEGEALTVAAGPPGEIRVTARVTVLGRPVAVTADAEVHAEPGRLEVTPTQLDTDSPLDRVSRVLVGHRLSFDLPTAQLPFGQRVTDIRPGPDAITVEAAGRNVVLSHPQS